MPVSLYRPRRPRASPLWQCLAGHREEFFAQYGARFEKQDGRLRPEIESTLDAFEACGDLSRGFAHLHCDHCGHDYLIAFSCQQRYFCPSCHQKKVQQFGEFVRHEVARRVPHRQIVLTIPKRLRKAFQFDRHLLTDLCQAAWLSIRDTPRCRCPSTGTKPTRRQSADHRAAPARLSPHPQKEMARTHSKGLGSGPLRLSRLRPSDAHHRHPR